MAEKTSILDKIKALFDQPLPTSFKLADGTDVTISLLDVGGDFSIQGLAEIAGNYTLITGENITVDSTGKITKVEDPGEFSATEYTLLDGTKVTIDKLETGGKVMQGDQAIANGEYTLMDGSKITVEEGFATAVTPKSTELKITKEAVQSAYDAMTGAAPDVQQAGIVSCIKALMDYWNDPDAMEDAQNVADAIAAVATMSAQFGTQESVITKLKTELAAQKELTTKILELMTQLAEAPSGDPPPNERKIIFSGEKAKTKKTALERYAIAAEKLVEQNKERETA